MVNQKQSSRFYTTYIYYDNFVTFKMFYVVDMDLFYYKFLIAQILNYNWNTKWTEKWH